MSKNTNGGSTPKIPSTSEEQDAVRRAKKSRQHANSGGRHAESGNDAFSIVNMGRELQVSAMKKEIDGMELNERQLGFLNAMISVYATLEQGDRKVTTDTGTKTISMVSATFRKIEAAIGEETLGKFRQDWSATKTIFFKWVNETHPMKQYCAIAQAKIDEETRQAEEHLSQSLGSLIDLSVLQPA